MKKLSDIVLDYLEDGFFSSFYLIKISLDSIDIYYSSLPYDVTFEGNLYIANSNLVNINAQKMSTIVDKETFKIKFADPDFIFRPYCDNMSVNGNISVRIGFFNTSNLPIYSTGNLGPFKPSTPILDPLDMITVYEGYIEKPTYIFSQNDGILLELECSAPLGALDANNVMYTSTFSLKQRIPYNVIDTCFDQITLGGKRQEILWGRNTPIE